MERSLNRNLWRSASEALRIRVSRCRRWLPLVLIGGAALAALLAALVPTAAPVRHELILVQDVSASVARSQSLAVPAFVERLAQEADIVEYIWVADRAWAGTGPAVLQAQRLPAAGAGRGGPGSDLAQGLERAMAVPRAGRTRRRILLLSDGLETRGDAAAVARSASSDAVVESVAMGSIPTPDARAVRLSAPGHVRLGARATVELLANSAEPMRAEAVLRDAAGRELDRRAAMLTPAGVRLSLQATLDTPGVQTLSATVRVSGDLVPENDVASAAILVTRPARVLWLGRVPPAWLAPPGITLEHVAALHPDRTEQAGGIVLDNVPLKALPAGGVRWLRAFVEGGGGLMVIGGDQSLGPGAYNTARVGEGALSQLLPVRIEPTNSLGLVFALDVSGSMAEPVEAVGGRVTKLDRAATAIHKAWGRLVVGDRAGLVVFAKDARVLLPVVRLETRGGELTRKAVSAAFQELQAGGGTRLCTGLSRALDQIQDVRARRRHILVVTDGDTEEKGAVLTQALARISERLRQGKIGLSIIAVGAQADHALLQRIARETGARVLFASDRLVLLPEILADELRKGRHYQEQDVTVGVVAPHAITRGLEPATLPRLRSLIAVGPEKRRQGAVSLLTSQQGDPLAAAWQVGLGRVVVLTGAPWQEWGWDAATGKRFAHQALAWCAAMQVQRHALQARLRANEVAIEYGADTTPDAAADSYTGQIVPLHSANAHPQPQSIVLVPTAPGLWSGSGQLPAPGLYRVDVSCGQALQASVPLLVPAQQEWQRFGADGTALARIALAGGGDVVASYAQFVPWERIPVRGGRTAPAASPGLLIAAVALLLLGLAASAWR